MKAVNSHVETQSHVTVIHQMVFLFIYFIFGSIKWRKKSEQLHLAVVHFIFSHLININTYLLHLDYARLKSSAATENLERKKVPIHNTLSTSLP